MKKVKYDTGLLLRSLLTTFFGSLDAGAVPFCVLRNYDTLPGHTDNDVDILVDRNHFEAAVQILYTMAGRAGLTLHMHIEHACLLLMFHASGNPRDQYHIDLYTEITWKGFSLGDPEEILLSRRRHHGFYIPDPAWEQAVNLLAGLVYQGRVKRKYRQGIHKTAVHKIHGNTLLSVLNRVLGTREGCIIWKQAQNSAWESIEKRYRKVQNALVVQNMRKNLPGLLRRQTALAGRLVRRLVYPAGISMAVIGPDGAGKSTLIWKLVRRLTITFKGKQRIVHWRPELLTSSPGSEQPPETAPHEKPVRGRAMSMIFFTYHTLMFILGYALKLAPLRLKGWAIFLDRYYYDFFVDLKRFRLVLSNHWVDLGFFFVPKPDIVLLLDAPPEVLRMRKKEVSEEETLRQCRAYRQLARNLPNSYILNADQPVDRVADDALKIIIPEVLTQKAEHRRKRDQWRKH
ncbi:MAG: hypothetical protein MI863_26430 [Desulfobacterales bacterium]|nr:hypothetical protein [Desulfobacterales bacterium]